MPAIPVEGVDYHYENGRVYPGPAPSATNVATEPSNYSVSPSPTAGRGAFGAVPGQVGLPNVAQQLQEQVPNLTQLNQEASSDVLGQLRGELSPDTVNAIRDAGAAWGVSAGIPGGGLATNRSLKQIGLAAEDVQQRGQENYSRFVPTVSQTQTINPETQIQTSLQNAVNAAAPDPTQAAAYAESLFNKYLEKLGGNNPVTVNGVPLTSGQSIVTPAPFPW